MASRSAWAMRAGVSTFSPSRVGEQASWSLASVSTSIQKRQACHAGSRSTDAADVATVGFIAPGSQAKPEAGGVAAAAVGWKAPMNAGVTTFLTWA